MRILKPGDIAPSEITPREVYLNRRQFMAGVAALAAAPALAAPSAPAHGLKLPGVRSGPYSTSETKTPFESVTTYNNFYEFGTGKDDPAENAHTLRPRPWTVAVEGEVKRPRTYGIDELLKLAPLEERIYRLRCVEGWSMVIPWVGFPLAELMKQVEPTGNAKFVEFISLLDPKQMPMQRTSILDWPYTEGLRIDEAANPLTLLAVGLYGEILPNQNGAPIRLVVPWKYGFKSAKSIVKIRFVEKAPLTSWMRAAPDEYGFFSNVNPGVDHPRWSQARERRLGEFFKRDTLMFNGYGEQVAQLYRGMDLHKYF
jgi:sulfoxide reductase catalytic subunit YedY